MQIFEIFNISVIGCTKYGSKYKEGEIFGKNHLRYECKNGMTNIIGKIFFNPKKNRKRKKDTIIKFWIN